jgi:AraC-like DNA-binding protein
MISALNRLVDLVEEHLGEDPDVATLAKQLGTTEYHLRRMFSSLAGMPLSEYVRRRRMTVAAADVVRGSGDLLGLAIRHGYGSTEAFGRAFRAVHGVTVDLGRHRHRLVPVQPLASAPRPVRRRGRRSGRRLHHRDRRPVAPGRTRLIVVRTRRRSARASAGG